MNTISIIKNLIERNNSLDLNTQLSATWNKVWNDNGKLNYANLRLFKTIDKIKKISEAGVNFKNKKILDIGCGNGTTMMFLRKYFDISGVGVDISDHIVKELKSNINDSKLSFAVGDHRDLKNIKSDQFDIILSFGVIEHLSEYNLALVESRRVLKSGGCLVLIQPHLLSFGVIQEFFLRLSGKWKFGNQKDFSCFRYKSLLQQSGYKNIKYFTAPPYSDMNITRVFDSMAKRIIPFWGHYLYIIANK